MCSLGGPVSARLRPPPSQTARINVTRQGCESEGFGGAEVMVDFAATVLVLPRVARAEQLLDDRRLTAAEVHRFEIVQTARVGHRLRVAHEARQHLDAARRSTGSFHRREEHNTVRAPRYRDECLVPAIELNAGE